MIARGLLGFLLLLPAPVFLVMSRAAGRLDAPPIQIRKGTRPAAPEVRTGAWRIESTPEYDTYSNGLRIENRFMTANHPRFYRVYPVNEPGPTAGTPRTDPAGIVFHATESPQAPFEEEQNERLRLIGASLLDFVRVKRAYHFVIDRFGRVYRVVKESDSANHAGHSVWADERWLYRDLNDSFIGISFEARTEPGQGEAPVSAAQLHAAAALTEVLRARYNIPAGNCVTHAQVSVNPANMRIGYHTDWASGFPYERVGLPNNYALPLPAVWAFGFECDPEYLQASGDRMYTGIRLAEEKLRESAARANCPMSAYAKLLRSRYRETTPRSERAATREKRK